MLLPLLTIPAGATSIVRSGSWSPTPVLLAGAGSHLQSTYESVGDEISLTISGTSGNWQVAVRATNILWDNSLHLFVKRSGNGTGGSVSGGTSYIEIIPTDTLLFTGSGDTADITIQLKVTGVSVWTPVSAYATTITYTLTDGL
ncbi:MAG: hypothetical protein ACYDBB_13825 [Armatimonadota bacterium]